MLFFANTKIIYFELHVYPGTGRKVCGGWWWVECEFSILLWSKPFPSGFSFYLDQAQQYYPSNKK